MAIAPIPGRSRDFLPPGWGVRPAHHATRLTIARHLEFSSMRGWIARQPGKSKTYVGSICALIDRPDGLPALHGEGSRRGVKELHKLRLLQESRVAPGLGLAGTREFVSRRRSGLTPYLTPANV